MSSIGDCSISSNISTSGEHGFSLRCCAPKGAAGLERTVEARERQMEEDKAIRIEDVQRSVTEIEMVKVGLYLVKRHSTHSSAASNH